MGANGKAVASLSLGFLTAISTIIGFAAPIYTVTVNYEGGYEEKSSGSLTDVNEDDPAFLEAVLAFAVLAFLFALVASAGSVLALMKPALRAGKVCAVTGFAISMICSVLAFSVFAADFQQFKVDGVSGSYNAAFYFQVISFALALAGVVTAALVPTNTQERTPSCEGDFPAKV